MNLFGAQIITPPQSLPITTTTKQAGIAAAVVEEVERIHLWRAVVRQERRILIDGPLDHRLDLEPVQSIVGLTRWTPTDAAEVIDAASYSVVTRDPAGTIIAPSPGSAWPAPFRLYGSFALTYMAGWVVTPETALNAGDAVNDVPASLRLMIERAVAFRQGAGLGDIAIGSIKLESDPSYKTDRLPSGLVSIGLGWAYRPGLFSASPSR